MAEVSYTTVPGKITSFLAKIREVGKPAKVTNTWLESIGFKSSNDRTLVRVLKQTNLVTAAGAPTETWSKYRGGDHRRVLGEAIKDGYSGLFSVYSDAHSRSDGELAHVFSTSSSAGKATIDLMVGTFKALVSNADFEAGGAESQSDRQDDFAEGRRPREDSQHRPNLHIDLQIHISPDSTPELIDQIFSSMAKHLYGNRD